MLTNEQHIGSPLPGSLHQEVLGIPPPSEVELQELQFLPLNLRSSSWKTGQEPLPDTWATFLLPLSAHVRHLGGVLQLLAASPTGVFPVGVAAAPGPVAVPKAPETAGDFHVLANAARYPPDPQFT